MASSHPETPPPTDSGLDPGPLPTMLFHVLRRAEQAVLADLNGTLAAEDLRPLAFSVLLVLKHNPGLRQAQVSFALGILRANFVPLMDGLERRGLAERRAIAGDRRAKGLFLTRLGDETLARLEGATAAHEARMAARLGSAGRQQLLALLHRLADRAFDLSD